MSRTIDNRVQVMFPEEFIELQRELPLHPDLVEILQQHPPDELEIRLAQICSYCEIMLDGHYTQDDLRKIAGLCTKRLIEKRTGFTLIGGIVQ